jgi:hypothetical protein
MLKLKYKVKHKNRNRKQNKTLSKMYKEGVVTKRSDSKEYKQDK